MEQLKVYNRDGNVTGEMEAPEFLLGESNLGLMHQIYKAMAANKRIATAHTKNRGEVSGGGIKPWKQKGTGRARQGSIRSPIWRHGGVTHGPRKDKDYSKKFNKKMGVLALRGALAVKLNADKLKVLNELEIKGKTKDLAPVIRNLANGKSALLVVANGNKEMLRAAKNLKNTAAVQIKDLNIYDVLNHQYVILEKQALNGYGK